MMNIHTYRGRHCDGVAASTRLALGTRIQSSGTQPSHKDLQDYPAPGKQNTVPTLTLKFTGAGRYRWPQLHRVLGLADVLTTVSARTKLPQKRVWLSIRFV